MPDTGMQNVAENRSSARIWLAKLTPEEARVDFQ